MTSPIAAQRASTLLDIGRPAEAISLLGPALAADPESAELMRLLARAYLINDQPADAMAVIKRAIAAEPDDEWSHRLLSQAYSELDDHFNAVKSAAEAQRLAPLEWRTHVRRAVASSSAGHLHDGWNAALEAVRLAPDQADSHFAMGFAASKNGDRDTAVRAYQQTLALQPDHATAMNNLASLNLGQRGGLRQATRGFGAALATDAQLSVARSNLHVVARRYVRRFHWGVLAAYLVFIFAVSGNDPDESATLLGPQHVSQASRVVAGVLGAVALLTLVVAALRLDRQLPANLRRYFHRLPLTDRWLGVWLALDVAALLVISAVAIPTTYDGRSDLTGLAWGLLLAGVAASWGPRLTRRFNRPHG